MNFFIKYIYDNKYTNWEFGRCLLFYLSPTYELSNFCRFVFRKSMKSSVTSEIPNGALYKMKKIGYLSLII